MAAPSFHDDDSYDDDFDLDGLPHEALLQLESNAIQFTQAQQTQASLQHPAPSSDYGDDFDDEDLDDNVVVDESRSTPAIIPAFQQHRISQRGDSIPQHLLIPQSPRVQRPLGRRPPLPPFNQSQQSVKIPHREATPIRQSSQPDKLARLQQQLEEVRGYLLM